MSHPTPTHRRVTLSVALSLATLAACNAADPAPDPQDGEATHAAVLDDEAQRYASDMAFFAARRTAYERTGAIPTVPPSLSSNPADPEYVFLRYVHVATAAERASYVARIANQVAPTPTTEELADYETTFEQDAAGGVIGVYVNDAGEMWGYRPRDIVNRLQARRAAAGDPNVRSTAASATVPDSAAGALVQALGMIGADNRELRSTLSGHSMTSYPWRAFGALVRNGTDTAGQPDLHCSATKIGERYLLTAGHCSFDAGGGKGTLYPADWWPGADGLGKKLGGADPSPNGKKNILWYFYSKKFVDKGWWSRDYAVLVLYDNASSCALGSLGYRVDNSLAGQSTWNFGYPGDSRSCAASPDPAKTCGGSLWGTSSSITRTEIPYIFYKHDTDHGQSGSAVYDYNGGNRQIVGHVQGTYTSLENRGIKLRNRVYDLIDSARDDHPSAACHY